MYSNNYYYGPESYQNCARSGKKVLPPVLVARVYSQPIIEEMSHYTVSLDVDNSCSVSNTRCDVRPICGCNDDGAVTFGYDYDRPNCCY